MESFHWDDNYVTGLADVDEQHHHLVNIINYFGDLLANNELIPDKIEVIFTELAEYAVYHFQEEEQLMKQVGLDPRHLTLHFDAHNHFLEEVAEIHDTVTPDNRESIQHLLDFLTRWLAYHILGLDQNMARQIKSIQEGGSAKEAFDHDEANQQNSTEPLVNALNSLFQQVSARNRELVKLNQSLEEKVAVRTKALSEANAHLEELALTDTLTKLPNRRHALRRLEDLWKESSQNDAPLTTLMIDADNYKAVNDTYGHDAGDHVLRELAQTLRHAVRTDDIVCRLGGDEFLIICPNTDIKGGQHIAEQTRQSVSELRVPTGDSAWQGSISIGLAVRTPHMRSHEDLIKIADEGVLIAKREGKNCVKTFG